MQMRMTCFRAAAGFSMVAAFGCATPQGGGSEWTMVNPTGREYRNEPVRLKLAVPADIAKGKYRITQDGTSVPYQVEVIDGKPAVWIAATLTATQTHTYAIAPGRPTRAEPMVAVREGKDAVELDNGVVALRLPSAEVEQVGPVGPVRQVRLPDGKWVGRSFWHTDRKLTNFTAQVIGDGTIFGKVRLRYEFKGKGGLFSEEESYYQADISLAPGTRHAVIEESYAMGRGDCWEFDAASGWDARGADVTPHFGGFGRPQMKDPDGKPYPWPPSTLEIGQTRMGDTLLNLVPRWSQAYDDGWYFAAMDDRNAVGALACRAGKWLWPYDSMIEIRVKESADYAGMRCPTWRGKRYWYLVAGPKETWVGEDAKTGYVLRHAVEGLDKLHQEYILDWPGLKPPEGKDLTPEQIANWGSGAGRFSRRNKAFAGWGPGGAHWSGSEHPITHLTGLQARLDPDTYGTHWLYYSPENPNFFSSWVGGMIGGVEKLKDHPQFDAIKRLVEQKVLEELYFGVTMPGGAGQECFGYMARGSWKWHEDRVRRIGCDTSWWPWRRAAGSFIYKMSYPLADGRRRSHPGGDTHPPGPDPIAAARDVGALEDSTKLKTEEFPGFGVRLLNNAGTPRETYFAFKSGPSRGHFHGDQLAFHYAANGHPLIVDHHCSYGPRAGQEHMHNRVVFFTDEMPWANMDGYERVIAFKASDSVDIAIGEVESERLREKLKFPPERWDWSLPQVPLEPNLRYRRTVLLLKKYDQDYIVIRDQSVGPDLYAAYCLHVYGETCEQKGKLFSFEGVQVFVAKPDTFKVSRHDWNHSNGGPEYTKGLRLTTKGTSSEFITVLMPRPRRLFPVTRLTLKGALARRDTNRRTRKTTISHHDMGFVLTWRDRKLLEKVHAFAPGYDRKMWFKGSVVAQDKDGLVLKLKGQGLKNRQKQPKEWEFAMRLTRKGGLLTGAFEGLVDAKEVSGEATGTYEEEGASPVLEYGEPDHPPVKALSNGVKIGETEVLFDGGIDDVDGAVYVSVKHSGKELMKVTGDDIDMDRSQGEIGIFVPDAGYPFGVLPDWLLRQRVKKPGWYEDVWPPARSRE